MSATASTRLGFPRARTDEYLLVVDGAGDGPGSVLACAAARRARPVGDRRHRRVRVDRRGLAGRRARRARDLRAPRRHVHRGRDVRRRRSRSSRALRELGVTAIELMPVATFPGERGWGYDGVYTYAPHRAYGGPRRARASRRRCARGRARRDPRRRLQPRRSRATRRCARSGRTSRPSTRRSGATRSTTRSAACASGRSRTPSSGCATTTSTACGSTRCTRSSTTRREHICAELAARVRDANPRALVISEMEIDDWRPIDEWGHDAQWADRAHHELHVLLTGEHDGYYAGYGSVARLARRLCRAQGHDPRRLVVCAQNHDQVGNRALGDRLPPDALRVAAAVTLFSPCTPLLFMGEESLEPHPFQFFTDHIDPAIAEATREGRKREFEAFAVLLRRGRARPAGGRDVPALEALRRASPTRSTASCSRSAASCRARSPSRPTRTPTCCACAAATSSSSRTSAPSRYDIRR